MSSGAARRVGVLILLVVLGGAFLFAFGPRAVGAVRLAGVSLLWWYAGLVGPVVAGGATALVLLLAGRR